MKKFRYIVFIVCSLFFLFHIVCTITFNFTSTYDNTLLQRVVRRYMLPVFSQNNKVFAPDPPGGKQQLLVRYYRTGIGWSPWFNFGRRYLDKTYSNRFSIDSYKNRVHEYVLEQVYTSNIKACSLFKNDSTAINNYLMNDKASKMAVRYFSNLAQNESNITGIDYLQYKVLFICPEEFSSKPYSEIKADTTTYNFPIINLASSALCSN